MTQDDKDLLLKDLCGRLPYGVKVEVNQDELQKYDNHWNNWNFDEEPQEIDGVNVYGVTLGCMDMSDGTIPFEYIKPYLFPLSSMSEEQKKEYDSYVWHNRIELAGYTYDAVPLDEVQKLVDFCNKNHFDYRGLLDKSLAIDATNLNIY